VGRIKTDRERIGRIALGLLVLLVLGSPQRAAQAEAEYNVDLLIIKMEAARDIHLQYLEVPESEVTGDYNWHRGWIATYDQVIAVLEEAEQERVRECRRSPARLRVVVGRYSQPAGGAETIGPGRR